MSLTQNKFNSIEQNIQGQRQEVVHGDVPEARAQEEHQAEPRPACERRLTADYIVHW